MKNHSASPEARSYNLVRKMSIGICHASILLRSSLSLTLFKFLNTFLDHSRKVSLTHYNNSFKF